MLAEKLPTLNEVVQKVTAPDPATPVHAATVDDSTGKGGTTSAPKEEAAKEEPKVEVVPEAKKEEAPKEAPKKDPQSSRFAALTRKEKELRHQSQEIDRKMKEAEAREQALKEREDRWSSAKKRPAQALKELGFSYSDITADVLGTFKEAEEDPVDKKIKPYADRFDKFESNTDKVAQELKELKETIAVKEQQENYNRAMSEIRSTVEESPDEFELVTAIGDEAYDLIKDIIVEYYKTNQKLLDYKEAGIIAEKYYESEYLSKLAGTKKFKSRLPQPEPSKPSTKKEAKEPTTLTNSLSTGSQAKVDLDKMSKQEAIAYLAKKLQFKET